MWKVETEEDWVFKNETEVYPIEEALKIDPDDHALQGWKKDGDNDKWLYGKHQGEWCGIAKEDCKQYFNIGDEVSFNIPQRGRIIGIVETGYVVDSESGMRHLAAEELTIVKKEGEEE